MTSTPRSPLPLPATLRLVRGLEFPRKLGLLDRWYGRALATYGVGWVRTAPGPVWKLDLANQTHRWIVYGWYEGPALWRWVRRHRPQLRTIVDSGANIGQTVLNFSALLPEARILAYEPGTAAREWLAEGVAANGLSRVLIQACGLGAAPTKARLANTGADDRHGAWNQVSETEGEPIEIATLDAELDRLGVDSLDLWKLDLEGYEAQALRGAAGALAAGRIRAVYAEIADENGRRTTEVLAAHGYRPHRISPSGRLTPWRQGHPYECALFLAPGAESTHA